MAAMTHVGDEAGPTGRPLESLVNPPMAGVANKVLRRGLPTVRHRIILSMSTDFGNGITAELARRNFFSDQSFRPEGQVGAILLHPLSA
jgi:hypothetical protein